MQWMGYGTILYPIDVTDPKHARYQSSEFLCGRTACAFGRQRSIGTEGFAQ